MSHESSEPNVPGAESKCKAPRRRARSFIFRTTAILAVTLAVAACGGGATKTSGTTKAGGSTPAAGEKAGGIATVALSTISNTLDPGKTREDGDADGPDTTAIYGELAYENPKTAQVVLGFLQSITSSPDFKTWTLTLRPGLKFSDGTPFNAAAIEYNYARDAQPATASLYQTITQDFKMKVVNATTLEVSLPSPHSDFPSIIAESLSAIGSPTAMKSEGANFGSKPVGAGPFMVTSFSPGESVTMAKNPNYALFAPGQPKLDGLKFEQLANTDQQVAAIKEGEAQVGQTIGLGDQNSMAAAGAIVDSAISGGAETLWLNQAVAPFNDKVAREAFTLAVNRTAIAAGQLPETPPVTNLFPKSSPYYDPKFNQPAQDPAKAQQLFNQLAAEGKPFKLTFTTVPTSRGQQLAATIQSELAAYKNTTVTIRTVPSSAWVTDERAGNYEGIIDDMFFFTPMPVMGNTLATGASLNTFHWSNPTVDATFKKIEATNDPATLKGLYDTLQTQMADDYMAYWGAQGINAIEVTPNMTGLTVIDDANAPLWGELAYKS